MNDSLTTTTDPNNNDNIVSLNNVELLSFGNKIADLTVKKIIIDSLYIENIIPMEFSRVILIYLII